MSKPFRLHFICNGVFSTGIAGGDIHFMKLAEGAARAGYDLNYFGGHALQHVLREHQVPGSVTLTDDSPMARVDQGRLAGQFALFRDMFSRYRRTMKLLQAIAPEDIVYAVSDYWFDVLPAVRCPARRKLMVLHMDAPRLAQIIGRTRPDVDPMRLASLHYWASQEWSLRRFASLPGRTSPGRPSATPEMETEGRGGARHKHILCLHPHMRPRLRRLGLREDEMTLVSYGLDVAATDAVPEQKRTHDVVWIGRVHRQKGIDDLLGALAYLAKTIPDFKAVLIGNLKERLGPLVDSWQLSRCVEFSGFVSEDEKTRLFKSSRLFLMPSKHEGSPRVIGESIVCRTPVVAYDIPNYRPIFGDFVRYVPPFDLEALQKEAGQQILRMRDGRNYLDQLDLKAFKMENSWDTTQSRFLQVLKDLE